MFAKKNRLTRKAFSRFFTSGKRFHGPSFQLIYSSVLEDGVPFKVAASVSKKVYKNAVDRNRLRRQMYHAVRRVAPLTGTYIVIAKSSAASLSYQEVEGQIQKLIGDATETG